MQYREMRKAGVKVSALGLGCMRLPQAGRQVDRPHALRMMRTAVERGINYFDSAYMYHGGESELVIADAIEEAGRDKIMVATKIPCPSIQSKEELERTLDDQLRKLRVDAIDFYLLHAISANTWKKMLEFDILTFLDKAVEKGKIRFTGFSHHDSLENFKTILDAYPKWAVAQVLLNYMDGHYQAGLEGCEYAADKGVGVVVMEPLKGGMLVKNVPGDVTALFKARDPDISLVEWALRWVYGVSQVSCILTGANNIEQLEENIAIFEKFERVDPFALPEPELQMFEDARIAFMRHSGICCTTCRYCMPCPSNVDIPGVFANYNFIKMFDSPGTAKMRYARLVYSGTSGDMCTACGRCEGLCPQKLPIIELLKEAHPAMV